MYNWNIKSRLVVIILLLGDLMSFSLALWVSLTIRYFFVPYGSYIRSYQLLLGNNFLPFILVFLLWVLVFYLADFYSTLIIGYRLSLAQSLLKIHFINSVIAIIFFYIFLPYFYIAPKVNLVLYLILSYIFIFLWRGWGLTHLKAAFGGGVFYFIGPETELKELLAAFTYNPYYNNLKVLGAKVSQDIKSEADIDLSQIEAEAARGFFAAIVAPTAFGSSYQDNERLVRKFYEPVFKGVQFFSFQKFYESVFHKIPISLVDETWLLENISSPSRALYDFTKRIVDILISLSAGLVSLIFYPFIILAIKLDDGGPIFYVPERIGQNGKNFRPFKFRTMKVGAPVSWFGKNDPRVTRVGRFLRKTSLDELPQLWNVFLGDISMVGPRPDVADFARELEQKIPYYKVRTLIKPGLAGWALVSQKVKGENPSSVEETRERLAYDLYYIKNRSFILDMAIILKTINMVFKRLGIIKKVA
ncbi:MAG: exopolysaccharide biosynthesis polyprenyl glycosylphosphotransferase [Candidatus Giovannonibacteria bacterium]|nr:exopolysaccharide biosynthesis polyprenyl glycosylphosphotransferase [Candidatus Giovannonibacteria bacterium]